MSKNRLDEKEMHRQKQKDENEPNEKELRHQKQEKEYKANIAKLSKEEKMVIEKLWKAYTKARIEFEHDYNLFSGITTDFQQQLSFLLKMKKTTAEKVAGEIGIEAKTLSRYRHGRNAPSMQVLIAICMVLNLDIKQSTVLLTSLGFCFLGTSKEHYAYMRLIENHRGASIVECNKILTGLHIDKKYHLYPRKAPQNK